VLNLSLAPGKEYIEKALEENTAENILTEEHANKWRRFHVEEFRSSYATSSGLVVRFCK
jgi:hypothetical protein